MTHRLSRGLSAFEAIVGTGSFAAAAQALHVTPSAISHRVRALEAQFGVELFKRDGQLRLTSDGERLHAEVGPALQALREVGDRLARSATDTLCIALPLSLRGSILGPPLFDFVRQHPAVSIDVTFVTSAACSGDVPYDVVPARDRDREEPMLDMELGVDIAVPMAHKCFIDRHCLDGSPQALMRHRLLEGPRASWSDWFRLAGGPDRRQPPNARFDDGGLMLEAVVLGHGVGMCPRHAARSHAAAAQLRTLSTVALPLPGVRLALTRVGRRNPAAQALRSWLNGRG